MTLRIGGMALENGVLLQTRKHWAAAVRKADGDIAVAGGSIDMAESLSGLSENVPLVRGPLRLAQSVVALMHMKRELPWAKLPFQSWQVMGAAVLASLGIGVLRQPDLGKQKVGSPLPRALLRELGAATLALVPAAIALRGSELAAYHGAEHKTIGQYERLAGGRQEEASTEHERCGSNLVVPLLVFDIIGGLVVRRLFRRPSSAAYGVAGLASLACAYEVGRWAARRSDHPLAKAIGVPGAFLQRVLTTAEPSKEQEEVARAALVRLLELEGQSLPLEPKLSNAG